MQRGAEFYGIAKIGQASLWHCLGLSRSGLVSFLVILRVPFSMSPAVMVAIPQASPLQMGPSVLESSRDSDHSL